MILRVFKWANCKSDAVKLRKLQLRRSCFCLTVELKAKIARCHRAEHRTWFQGMKTRFAFISTDRQKQEMVHRHLWPAPGRKHEWESVTASSILPLLCPFRWRNRLRHRITYLHFRFHLFTIVLGSMCASVISISFQVAVLFLKIFLRMSRNNYLHSYFSLEFAKVSRWLPPKRWNGSFESHKYGFKLSCAVCAIHTY